MRYAISVVVVGAVALAAAPVAGQNVLSPHARLSSPIVACCPTGEEVPMASSGGGACSCGIPLTGTRQLSRSNEGRLSSAHIALSAAGGSPIRVGNTGRVRTYALWGGVGGAVAGAIWGAAMMRTAEDWIGPPAFVVTVPAGVLAGALVGAAVGALTK